MKTSIGIRQSYQLYKQDIKNPVKIEEYITINEEFMGFLMDRLLSGQMVKLPEGLGTLEFVGKKIKPNLDENGNIKGLSPNWAATNKFWKDNPEAKERKEVIFHFNEHSNGIRYKMYWSKKHVFIQNKDFYSFILSRENKRKFNSAILNGTEFLVDTTTPTFNYKEKHEST